jgi:hypothetical protein
MAIRLPMKTFKPWQASTISRDVHRDVAAFCNIFPATDA